MKSIGIGFVFAIIGFVVLAVIGYYWTLYFSSGNQFKKMEAGFSGLLFFGPVGFVVAFILGYFWSKT